jgi:XTP/dITP diphosphohydrolase
MSRIMYDLPVVFVTPNELGLDLRTEETGETFAENALLKARAFAAAMGDRLRYIPIVLADDSGLCVDALGGAPGIYSARYGGPDLDDATRTRLILDALKGVPAEKRTAHFVCAIAVVTAQGDEWMTEGRADGIITCEPRGTGGFGYDPIFLVPSLGRTFAELTPDEKAAISHRGQALQATKERLRTLLPLLQ